MICLSFIIPLKHNKSNYAISLTINRILICVSIPAFKTAMEAAPTLLTLNRLYLAILI